MKRIWYIGFFDGDKCSERRKSEGNIAGTVYMRGLINSLKRNKYHVSIVSLQMTQTPGIYKAEHIKVDEYEEQYFLPYITVKIGGRLIGGKTIVYALKTFLEKNVEKNEIVISYHSIVYGNLLTQMRNKLGFIWIPEVNEIYCLSRQDYENNSFVMRERDMFAAGDAYIFASDALARQYANNKPYVVLYGAYDVIIPEKVVEGENINIVYTGIINQDRGVYKIIESMELLPNKYKLFILGFGRESEINKMKERVENVNIKRGREGVFYCGTKVGKAYSEFLSDKHIGVSLMNQKQEISNNAFPGKILSYMGHSLQVLSSDCDSIVNSRLGKHIYFCDNTPKEIAGTIEQMASMHKCNNGEVLGGMCEQFEKELKDLLEGLRGDRYED